MTLPNWLTLFRIVLIPVLMLVFYLPFSWSYFVAAGIFTIASVTDWLDGYLARRLGQTSAFGAFLDPVADKLMVGVALVLLVEQNSTLWFTIPAVVIIGREIVISALREWMAELGERASTAVNWLGKVKTTMQMIAIILWLAATPAHEGALLYEAAYVALYLAALLTIWSMIIYLKVAMPLLIGTESTK